MAGASLPPGFRFHPTDEELVGYYLQRRMEGLEIELEVIPAVDLYKFDPWELPEKSFLPNRDREWFFFCPRDKKYPNGSRSNRATRSGYWKATGKDRKVVCRSGLIGYRKTLVFYHGRAPVGDRTDWVMHEYRLADDVPQATSNFQGRFALCRVVKKNEHSKKIIDFEAGATSRQGGFSSAAATDESVMVSDDMPMQASLVCNGSNYSTPITSPYLTPVRDCEKSPISTDPASLWITPDMILDPSKESSHGRAASECYQQHDCSDLASWKPHDQYDISSSNSNYGGEAESLYDCFSAYSCIELCGNEDTLFGGLGTWNQAQVCRQSSGDPIMGKFSALWQQEDNLAM